MPEPVINFLSNKFVASEATASPHQMVDEHVAVQLPPESQMVPLPSGFGTGMAGLLTLGFFRAAKQVRKTFV